MILNNYFLFNCPKHVSLFDFNFANLPFNDNSMVISKKMKIALYQSQREIHTVDARAAPGDLGLKSHPKDYQQKLTYHYGHTSKYRPRLKLLNPSVLDVWP